MNISKHNIEMWFQLIQYEYGSYVPYDAFARATEQILRLCVAYVCSCLCICLCTCNFILY